jgi:hypothetical protein
MSGLDLVLIAVFAGLVTALIVAACHYAPR